ncbi:MAG: hypothetical protein ABL967_07490 [Bryobacteraceae bacterium]
MKKTAFFVLGLIATFSGTLTAGGRECVNVSGTVLEVTVPVPPQNPPRVAGPVNGSLNGAITAFIIEFNPQLDGKIQLVTQETFVTGPGDTLTTSGAAVLTPMPNRPPGDFNDVLTLTVTGGTGRWAGASSGKIVLTGKGYNFFDPEQGNAYFQLSYRGTVCRERRDRRDDD